MRLKVYSAGNLIFVQITEEYSLTVYMNLKKYISHSLLNKIYIYFTLRFLSFFLSLTHSLTHSLLPFCLSHFTFIFLLFLFFLLFMRSEINRCQSLLTFKRKKYI